MKKMGATTQDIYQYLQEKARANEQEVQRTSRSRLMNQKTYERNLAIQAVQKENQPRLQNSKRIQDDGLQFQFDVDDEHFSSAFKNEQGMDLEEAQQSSSVMSNTTKSELLNGAAEASNDLPDDIFSRKSLEEQQEKIAELLNQNEPKETVGVPSVVTKYKDAVWWRYSDGGAQLKPKPEHIVNIGFNLSSSSSSLGSKK